MRNALQRWGTLLSCTCLVAVAGCDSPPETFQISTTIHADGSCRRTIYQPREGYLPVEAMSPDWISQWESISGASAPSDKSPTTTRQSGLPLACAKYFVAEGTFGSPHDIPPHYRYVAKGAAAAGASELVRDYQSTDFGLLVEHSFREALTDVATLDRFLVARDELLDLLLPIVIAKLEREYGGEYDVSGLAEYLRGDGRKSAEELCLLWYTAAVQKLSDERAEKVGVQLLRRHGLELQENGVPEQVKSGNGSFWEMFDPALERFVLKIVQTHVKHRDGRPLSEKEAKQFLDKPVFVSDPPRAGKSTNIVSQLLDEPLDAATEARIDALLAQLMGVYPWLRIFGGEEDFEFSLRLPGRVVETSGMLHEDGHVFWKFDSGEVYPTGYAMTARSLDFRTDVQQKLLGRTPIANAAEAEEFIALVGRQGLVLDAVREACCNGKVGKLRDLKATSPHELKQLNALRAMLGIEASPESTPSPSIPKGPP